MSRWRNIFNWREIILVAATFAFGAIASYPVRYFGTQGDIGLYLRDANALLAHNAASAHEYPAPAVLLFLLPHTFGAQYYVETFVALAAVALAVTILIVDRLTRNGFWLLTFFALGTWAVIFTRYDVFVVLLTVLGFAAAMRRHWILAQALVVAAAALKLYPLFLMPLVVLWQWRAERRPPTAALTSGAIFLFVMAGASWLVAGPALHQMLQYHWHRPFEFESMGASCLWLARPITIGLNYGGFNIEPSPATLLRFASLLTVLFPTTVYFAFARGRLQPAAAWALILLSILAVAKVFSPQYLIWVLPFVALAETATPKQGRKYHRALWVGICILTSLIYPLAVEGMFPLQGSASDRNTVMLLVTLRNLLWLLVCLMAAWRWSRENDSTSAPEPTHVLR